MVKQQILIDGKNINESNEPYLVAEIGLNHNNDMELAKKTIFAAKESGANAVKFQSYISEKLLKKDSEAFDLFKSLELTKSQFEEIFDYCKDIGITFFSTPFSYDSVDMLSEMGVSCFKIASMDLNYYEFVHYIAKTGKTIILSTGMANFGEIDKAINTIRKTGNENIVILHCISKYPPKSTEMDMTMIKKLKTLYPEYQVGFSDHTNDNTMAIVARVFGATLFEKHFTLDKTLPGPDHSISLEPKELLDLRVKLKSVDESINPYSKVRFDSGIALYARRSLYASKDLKRERL